MGGNGPKTSARTDDIGKLRMTAEEDLEDEMEPSRVHDDMGSRKRLLTDNEGSDDDLELIARKKLRKRIVEESDEEMDSENEDAEEVHEDGDMYNGEMHGGYHRDRQHLKDGEGEYHDDDVYNTYEQDRHSRRNKEHKDQHGAMEITTAGVMVRMGDSLQDQESENIMADLVTNRNSMN